MKKKQIANFDIEKELWVSFPLIAGVDEVGRGCLAGPVYSAAVIFASNSNFESKINDSKKLNIRSRLEMYEFIKVTALNIAFDYQDIEVIEKNNILNASIKSMNSSIEKLKIKPDYLLIDGNKFFSDNKIPFRTVVKGDSKSISIAAASIIAKVERDRFMKEVAHTEFPYYEFDKNVGYGTKKHIEAIKKYGVCKYHRLSFLKNIFNSQISLF